MLDQEARELLVKTYDEIRDVKKVAAIYGVSSWTVYFTSRRHGRGKVWRFERREEDVNQN